MNNTKEKQTRLQVIIAVLVLTIILFAEMYLMINFQDSYFAIILLAVVALAAVYVLINAVMTLNAEKEAKRNEHFENLYKSEKASYIMLKKSFDEIEERLNNLQEHSKIPSEELINAQKGIAKVIINRSKENADAIINSNDQVLERLDEVEETQNTKFTSLSKEQRLKLTDLGTQTESKFQDLLVQLKDTELRLNQVIMSGTKIDSVPNYISETQEEENILAQNDLFAGVDLMSEDIPLDELFPEEAIAVEEVTLDEASPYEETVAVEDPLLDEVSPFEEDIFVGEDVLEAEEVSPVEEDISVIEEPMVEESVVEEPVVEELPPLPDLSDPNKALDADEIAALFANMAGGDASAEEIAEVESEVETIEEVPPMPDLSDPNKVMSPDEIAALIANL